MSPHRQPRPYAAQRIATSQTELSRKFRMSNATAAKAWRTGLTLLQADRIAASVESHIDVVWPECAGHGVAT